MAEGTGSEEQDAGLLEALRAAEEERHRACIAVVGVAACPGARRRAAERLAALLRAAAGGPARPSLLICSRHGQPGEDVAGAQVTAWAFGQVQKSDCLGQTFDGVVVFDPEELMPETLWAAVETVRGGGVVAVVLPPDVAAEGPPACAAGAADAEAPGANLATRHALFRRLARVLWEDASCHFADASLRPLPGRRPAAAAAAPAAEEGEATERAIEVGGRDAETLLGLTRTEDQRRAVGRLLGGPWRLAALTGRRGRGKSSAAGLAAAGLLAGGGCGAAVLTAPGERNMSEVLSALRRGLAALGRSVSAGAAEAGRLGTLYVLPGGGVDHVVPLHFASADLAPSLLASFAAGGLLPLLVVDEAAALAVPELKALLGVPETRVLLASTLSGCEGTGGALPWKVLTGAAAQRSGGLSGQSPGSSCEDVLSLVLEEPIRYGRDCPVERMLDRLLFLGASADLPLPPIDVEACGKPERACLFEINSAELASPKHAQFAQALVALLQTHYRTSASDVANMLAQPYMRTFVSLPQGAESSLPVVAILCILESPELVPKEDKKCTTRVSRSHLTTFAIEQDFPQIALGGTSGMRVARVVCDPRLRGRGFGSAAMRRLLVALDAPASAERVVAGHGLLRTPVAPLAASWLSASFGLTNQLLRFWARLGFVPAVLSPTPNPQTGELSLVMLHPLARAGETARRLLTGVGPQLAARLVRGLQQAQHPLPTELCAELLAACVARQRGERPVVAPWRPGIEARTRLAWLADSQDPLLHLAHSRDLMQALAEAYFSGALAPLSLARPNALLLLASGGRGLAPAAAAAEAGLPPGAESANLAALGLRRAVGLAARRLGLCLGKEVLISAIPAGAGPPPASTSWPQAWLPPMHELHCGTGEARLDLRPEARPGTPIHRLCVAASWQFPVETEVGDLELRLPLKGSGEGEGWHVEARCFHQWHREEWLLEALGEAESQVEVPVSLAGQPPNPAHARAVLALYDPIVSSLAQGAPWAVAWLPPLEALRGQRLRLPVAAGLAVELGVRWKWPEKRRTPDGEVLQHGRGLLIISDLRLVSAAGGDGASQNFRVELRILHEVNKSAARLTIGGDESLCLRIRLKQNRPERTR